MDRINLAHNRDQLLALVKTVMNLRLPSNIWKLLSSWEIGNFSRRTHLHGDNVRLIVNDKSPVGRA
jgi:hypothetical protein